MIRSALLFLLVCGCMQARLQVALKGAMERVSRTESVTGAGKAELTAARGEWEPFQVVLHGPAQEVRRATVEVTLLTGPAGKKLPVPTVLRGHYVKVSKSTPRAPLPAGEYMDALVPLDFPWQELPKAGEVNQPYWVDVFVPYATPPGEYKGEIRVLDESRVFLATRPLKMTVQDFDLPVVPSLRTSIMTGWRRIAEVHGFDPQQEPPEPELLALLEGYADLLARHRLSLDQLYTTYPDKDSGKLDEATVERALRKHLLHRHASTLSLPIFPEWPFADPLGKDRPAAMAYAAQWTRLLEKLRSGKRGYVIMGSLDEPNSAEAYAQVRRWGAFFNEVEAVHKVRLPLLVTEQPAPDDPWWGRLDSFVDIWVPHFSQVWEDLEGPKPTRDIARRLAAGDEVWCYPALAQIPAAWDEVHGNPKTLKESNPPVWCLDYPAMNFRVLAWLLPRHGLTGITYWDTLFASPEVDVWADAGTFKHPNGDVYNGDGSFIYPATTARHGRHEPVASVRLKWLREMAEDYDYLTLAREAGHEAAALKAAETFARGFGDWKDDMSALYAARAGLAKLLVKKGGAER